ncbi:hypothetical protein PNP59_00030 [Halobacterium salinarum]|uniref:hypothetical protein n=1 Tax=Halobacterium salinarum TaxID=2242 RepID=UPI0025567338|nr:hypothetical protein [Halobacterium salinarum]MDL0129319.1 hypothetical protein [Halobacterium salinarum]
MDEWEQKVEIDVDSESPKLGRLRRQHEDIQHTLNHHLNDFEEQAERANRIARFDGIVLTIFVGFISQIDGGIPLSVFLVMVVGMGVVLSAVGLGLWEQRGREVEGGPHESTIQVAKEHEMGEEDYLEWILTEGYSDWVEDARKQAAKRTEEVRLITTLSIIGIILLLGTTLFVPVL